MMSTVAIVGLSYLGLPLAVEFGKVGPTIGLAIVEGTDANSRVVSGTAEVTNGELVTLVSANQSTCIPLSQVHRLANPGTVRLKIIEVQSGTYLGEDDIERFEDSYGRQ